MSRWCSRRRGIPGGRRWRLKARSRRSGMGWWRGWRMGWSMWGMGRRVWGVRGASGFGLCGSGGDHRARVETWLGPTCVGASADPGGSRRIAEIGGARDSGGRGCRSASARGVRRCRAPRAAPFAWLTACGDAARGRCGVGREADGRRGAAGVTAGRTNAVGSPAVWGADCRDCGLRPIGTCPWGACRWQRPIGRADARGRGAGVWIRVAAAARSSGAWGVRPVEYNGWTAAADAAAGWQAPLAQW